MECTKKDTAAPKERSEMPKDYSIIRTEDLTTVRFSKTISSDKIRNAIDDVAENSPTKMRLWDLTTVSYTLNAREIKILAEYGKSKPFPPSKVALIAPADWVFGLARMFEIYRKDQVAEHRVFRTEEEALVWLGIEENTQ